jgi:hypothetical protein
MEAELDLSHATVEALRSELDGLQKALSAIMSGAGPGRPFDGRDERLQIDLQQKIAAIELELAKRKAARP